MKKQTLHVIGTTLYREVPIKAGLSLNIPVNYEGEFVRRPVNPESQPVRVYDEKGVAIICVKRYPSFTLTYHQLQQLQWLLGLEPGLLDTASFLRRELGDDAVEKLTVASDKVGLGGSTCDL